MARGASFDGPIGFFDHNRRIRAQRFRGEQSDGLWMPLSSLKSFAEYVPEEGHLFTHIGEHEICTKWVARVKGPARPQGTRSVKRGELVGFPKHMDTDQWAYYKDQIPPNSLITVSEKLHGTSHRVGLVYVEDRKWWQFWRPRGSYVRQDGSRNVVITEADGRQSFYESDEFRLRATPQVGRKGEVLYGEIVGWVGPDTPIMPSVKVDKKELPDEFALYGPTMNYHYGQIPGQCQFYIYRIVQFNEDGQGVELSDAQVRRRARELGYQCPPLLFTTNVVSNPLSYEAFMTVVDENVQRETGQPSLPSLVDGRQIREGVVIRVDDPSGHTHFYKSKSFAFRVLEGIIKSEETYEDIEENS